MYMEIVKCVYMYFIENVFYDTSNSIVIVNNFFYVLILYDNIIYILVYYITESKISHLFIKDIWLEWIACDCLHLLPGNPVTYVYD